jgi:hypothetical protein
MFLRVFEEFLHYLLHGDMDVILDHVLAMARLVPAGTKEESDTQEIQ